MKLLALDTATSLCSVALQVGPQRFQRRELREQGQSAHLLPMIQQVLQEAGLQLRELDGLAFGRGPGGFTGVRLSVSVAQGLAYSSGLRLIGVSSLEAVALQALRRHPLAPGVIVCNDARMQQVYTARYLTGSLPVPVGVERVLSPQIVLQELSAGAATVGSSAGWVAAGQGWRVYESLATAARQHDLLLEPELWPEAGAVLDLAAPRFLAGDSQDPREAAPVYVRDDVARPPPVVPPR